MNNKKFVEGFNMKAATWNSGTDDGGRCPLRGSAREGYETCRSHILQRQLDGEQMNGVRFTVDLIKPEDAEKVLAAIDAKRQAQYEASLRRFVK